MFGSRSVRRLRGLQRVEAAAPPAAGPAVVPAPDDAVEIPLAPRSNLRAHWVRTAEGRLELRWELDGPAARACAA